MWARPGFYALMKEGSSEALTRIFACCKKAATRGCNRVWRGKNVVEDTRANVDGLREGTSTGRGGRGGWKIYVQWEILR